MYKISEVAKQTGLTTATLRYYEQIGLLQTKRKTNHYREFDDSDLDWLRFIENMKKTGMKLSEIKYFSNLKQLGAKSRQKRLELLEEQKVELIERIKEIEQSLNFLEEAKALTKNC